ncbi:MAG: prepilin-type N-terminal cleavage/methylation domain-containing protein [Thermodesulfovibrionales bacterium]|nr:prepilin-type N-terminal cleavage/methylation domain-containing protein [Thermodesulfovibrionales bacterium]
MNLHTNEGFSLVETMVVIVLVAILALVAIPSFIKYYQTYKYIDYASTMENLVRWARITAMERTINVGICREGNTLKIINMGTDRSNLCSGSIMHSLTITDNFVSLSGSGASFDPKGFAIHLGNVCITNSSSYSKVSISRFGAMRFEKGSGGCT